MTDHPESKFSCPDPGIAGTLSRLEAGQIVAQNTLAKIETHQQVANHRIEKLEHASLVDIGRQEERQKWQEREAEKHEAAIANVYKSIAAAGVISGIIFSVIDKVIRYI